MKKKKKKNKTKTKTKKKKKKKIQYKSSIIKNHKITHKEILMVFP